MRQIHTTRALVDRMIGEKRKQGAMMDVPTKLTDRIVLLMMLSQRSVWRPRRIADALGLETKDIRWVKETLMRRKDLFGRASVGCYRLIRHSEVDGKQAQEPEGE
jgi:hypothetical protein